MLEPVTASLVTPFQQCRGQGGFGRQCVFSLAIIGNVSKHVVTVDLHILPPCTVACQLDVLACGGGVDGTVCHPQSLAIRVDGAAIVRGILDNLEAVHRPVLEVGGDKLRLAPLHDGDKVADSVRDDGLVSVIARFLGGVQQFTLASISLASNASLFGCVYSVVHGLNGRLGLVRIVDSHSNRSFSCVVVAFYRDRTSHTLVGVIVAQPLAQFSCRAS